MKLQLSVSILLLYLAANLVYAMDGQRPPWVPLYSSDLIPMEDRFPERFAAARQEQPPRAPGSPEEPAYWPDFVPAHGLPPTPPSAHSATGPSFFPAYLAPADPSSIGQSHAHHRPGWPPMSPSAPSAMGPTQHPSAYVPGMEGGFFAPGHPAFTARHGPMGPATQSPQDFQDATLPLLRSEDISWVSYQAQASTSHGTPATQFSVPRFRHLPSGNIYGPLTINAERFFLKPYPLDIPFFRHLYSGDELTPVDFESFDGDRGGKRAYRSSESLFRPEPALLEAIQRSIWGPLEQRGVRPQKVLQQRPLEEGEYLWPPTQITSEHARTLSIADTFDHTAFRNRLTYRLYRHTRENPTIFHLNVQHQQATRHIMMFRVPPGSVLSHTVPENLPSDLWFFFEGYQHAGIRRRTNPTAFLGAMFLPKIAEPILSQANVIVPALPGRFL